MDENFADAPKSLGEFRAWAKGDASAWTARDALVSVLREIDSGRLKTDNLIIAYREMIGDGPGWTPQYVRAVYGSEFQMERTIGLLEVVKHKILVEANG